MKGFLFTIDDSYGCSEAYVESYEPEKCCDMELFVSVEQAEENPIGYVRDAQHQLIARLRRKNVLAELACKGFLPGSERPHDSYNLIAACPSALSSPESLYYEIKLSFEDMAWEFPGHPDNQD